MGRGVGIETGAVAGIFDQPTSERVVDFGFSGAVLFGATFDTSDTNFAGTLLSLLSGE